MTATMRYAHPDAIVDTQWLADNLRDLSLRVFDCTTYLRYETGTGRPYRVESGRADYDKGHIPGSAFLDLQGELSDDSARFNFTMPALDDLAARFVAKGIGEGTRAVLYSRAPVLQWCRSLYSRRPQGQPERRALGHLCAGTGRAPVPLGRLARREGPRMPCEARAGVCRARALREAGVGA
jgi:3-mercaptopyruvate sulfurtransferase SseA